MVKKLLPWLFVMALAFCGCGNTEISVESEAGQAISAVVSAVESVPVSSTEDSPQAEDDTIQFPPAELIEPDGKLLIYRFWADSKLYEANKLIKMPDKATLFDVFAAVFGELFADEELPKINAVTKQKSYVVFDLSEEWLDRLNKGELYEFCNTLAMTVLKNCGCENVGFMVDGEFGLLGGECWETEELIMLPKADAEQFAKIRAKIPYSGLQKREYDGVKMADSLQNDQTAQEIYSVLAMAGNMPKDFDTPNDHDMDEAILHLIWCTEAVKTYPQDLGYDLEKAQIILPLASSVSQKLNMQEDSFWLKEHIEQSARLIYGDDFKVVHQQPRLPYKWFETEGVYTPPHMGGGWNIMPYIFDYKEQNGVITAEVAYLKETMSGICEAANTDSEPKYMLSDDEVLQYLQNSAIRREITLKRESDGRLTIKSHHFI